MVEGLIFANARAKAKENGLFTKERLSRMLDCKTLESAVKILYEVGYGGGIVLSSPFAFDELLKAEEKLLLGFIRELKLEGIGLECFALKRDYHNVKAMLKAKYNNIIDYDYMLMQEGIYSLDKLRVEIAKENPKINVYIDEALLIIKKQAAIGTLSPRLIDNLIDKALFSDIKDRLKLIKDEAVKRYFKIMADCTNILSCLRVFKINENIKFFSEGFVTGGDITLESFLKWFDGGEDTLKKNLKGTLYYDFVGIIEEGELSRYETSVDDYLTKIFQLNSSDMFTSAPIISYFLQKLNEIKVIRIVLVCIKNNVNYEEIKKRLRVIYA